jgi:hypothetical protein
MSTGTANGTATNRALGRRFGKVEIHGLNRQMRKRRDGTITILEFDNAGAIQYTEYPPGGSRPSEIAIHWASLAPKKENTDGQ